MHKGSQLGSSRAGGWVRNRDQHEPGPFQRPSLTLGEMWGIRGYKQRMNLGFRGRECPRGFIFPDMAFIGKE